MGKLFRWRWRFRDRDRDTDPKTCMPVHLARMTSEKWLAKCCSWQRINILPINTADVVNLKCEQFLKMHGVLFIARMGGCFGGRSSGFSARRE